MEEYSSYIHIAHVRDLWGSTSELLPGKVFNAIFLYSLSPVNVLYFSLKNYTCESGSNPCFKDGTIIKKAEVSNVLLLVLYNVYKLLFEGKVVLLSFQ